MMKKMMKRLVGLEFAILAFLIGSGVYLVMPPMLTKIKDSPHEAPTAFAPGRKNPSKPCQPHRLYVAKPLYLADAEVVDPLCNRLQLSLVKAAQVGDLQRIRFSLAQGATPNATAVDSRFEYKRPLVEAAFAGQTQALKVLLDNGGDVNDYFQCCMTSESLLMIATKKHDTESVKLLLARGADAGFRGYEGETAFQIAADGGYYDILQLLDQTHQLSPLQQAQIRIAKLPGMNLVKARSAFARAHLD